MKLVLRSMVVVRALSFRLCASVPREAVGNGLCGGCRGSIPALHASYLRRMANLVESKNPQDRASFWYPASWVVECSPKNAVARCSEMRGLRVLDEPKSFSFTQWEAHLGPVALFDVTYGCDVSLDGGEERTRYWVTAPISGRYEAVQRGSKFTVSPGSAAIYQPDGEAAVPMRERGRTIAIRIDRCAVEDALTDVLGHQVASVVDFNPTMAITTGKAKSWMHMVQALREQMFRPDSVLNDPIVGQPFIDSLVRGLFYATDHPHRAEMANEPVRPRISALRTAIEIMEAEAHMPLTVSSIAARSYVSVRSLQEGFKHELGVSPMAYLREIRLRRAHQSLLESDPTTSTVRSVANRWGFTNLGRFSTFHTNRYGESPTATLRRTPIRR
jgi:AraC-like DNA-binding protein